MKEVLQKIRQTQKAKQQPSREKYLALVRELADGWEVDYDSLSELMAELSIDEEKLQRHVATMKELIAAKTQIATAEDLGQEWIHWNKLEAELLSEKLKFLQGWNARHDEVVAKISVIGHKRTVVDFFKSQVPELERDLNR